MNEDRLSILNKKLSKTPLDRIKSNLAGGNYASWKISHVEEYIKQQEQNTWLYHEKKAYKGKIFKRYEVPKLIKQGWVDTPEKFGKGLRGKWYRLTSAITNAISFYKKNWKVTVPLTAAVAVPLIGSFIQLYIHFDTKQVNESKKIKQQTETTEPSAASKQIKVSPGALLITHYPTGELFAVNPGNGQIALLSKRLGEPSAIAVRSNGEIVVLDSKHGLVIGVNPKDGSHTFSFTGEAILNQRPVALSLESDRFAIIAVQNRIIRLDLEKGTQSIVSHGGLFTKILGICVDIAGLIVVTDIGGKIIEVDPQNGTQRLISEGGLLNHPRGPIIESSQSVLVGTAGNKASIVRVDRSTGQQSVVATGPFVTIAGMVVADDDCIFVADNGRGASGDGFIAKVDLKKGEVKKIVTSQSTEWRFLNGRAVTIYPKT